MLTARKKAFILAKVGIDVPVFPSHHSLLTARLSQHDPLNILRVRESDAEQTRAVTRWNLEIGILYATYAAARAAKSLRDAEEVRQ